MKVSRDLNNCQNGDKMSFDFLTNLVSILPATDFQVLKMSISQVTRFKGQGQNRL